MNLVILTGRIGKDPETKVFQDGTKAVKFTLATSRKYRNKNNEVIEETQWHTIKIFGKTADVAEQYCKKGKRVTITGEIQYGSYEAQDGTKKYFTEIRCNRLDIIDFPENAQQHNESSVLPDDIPENAENPDDGPLPF